MGSGSCWDHWGWVSLEVYTWAGVLAPTGSKWRAGGGSSSWGGPISKLMVYVTGWFFFSKLHWFGERLSSVMNFGMGAKAHFSCPGIPLLVKDSLSSPECVKRHLIQTFNERTEDSRILNFSLGYKIVKSNKSSFLCTWLRIAGPFPSLLKTLASGRVSVTSYRTALDQIWNLLASFLPNHCSALPKHILLNSGYIRAVTFCANPTWPIYAVHFFSKSI